MEDFSYNIADKEQCWYKDICDHSKCGDEFCIRHYKMSALFYMATLEGKQCYPITLYPDKIDLDAFRRLRDIKSDIESFVKDGLNLLIYSTNTGNGKTEWSKKLLMSWFNAIWATTDIECRGLFIAMPRFIGAMKENISHENTYYQYVNENITKADLIVWDEINYKEWSPYEQEYMLSVLSHRLSIGKANIFTTNYDLPQIEQKLGSRLASRIIGTSEKIQLLGSDKRGSTVPTKKRGDNA